MSALLEAAMTVARAAEKILEAYAADFEVRRKSDQSPRLGFEARLYPAADSQDLAEHMPAVCDAEPALINLAGRSRFSPRPHWRPLTKFEQRGRRKATRPGTWRTAAPWTDAVPALLEAAMTVVRAAAEKILEVSAADFEVRRKSDLTPRLGFEARLYLAADSQDLAEHMPAVCDAEPALINQAGRGRFRPRPHWRPLTKFEQRGPAQGNPAWNLAYCRALD